MRGIKLVDLVAIVDFLQFGEAEVFQETLDSFLAIAEELKLEGLTETSGEAKKPTLKAEPTVRNDPQKDEKAEADSPPSYAQMPTKPDREVASVQENQISMVLQDLDEHVRSI